MTSAALGLFTLALLVPSVVLHEIAHGYVSLRHGDPTARDAGRLSLNPLRHVDLFGTVLLPLMLWSAGAPVFGYAKPVPVNPGHYADLRHGQLATGLAGPAANLALAILGGGAAWTAWLFGAADGGAMMWLWLVGAAFTQVNLVLMFFNLIPIPPLDGSSVLPLFSRTGASIPTTGCSGTRFRCSSPCCGACRRSSTWTRSAPTSGTPSTRSSTCSCPGSGRYPPRRDRRTRHSTGCSPPCSGR